jgi:fructose/tagatose bisphosphate aldolase
VLYHASTIDQIKRAIDLGFSGVMIDASLKPWMKILPCPDRLLRLLMPKGFVEAELGHVGQGDQIDSENQTQAHLTRVEDAKRFVRETGVDALAFRLAH